MKENFAKITNTVYGVLSFFPEGDPLKNKAKEKVLAIFDDLTLIKNHINTPQVSDEMQKAFIRIFENVELLGGYLDLARHQGWVSDVNVLIIKKEYQSIRDSFGVDEGTASIQTKPAAVGRTSEATMLPSLTSQRTEKEVAVSHKRTIRRKPVLAQEQEVLDNVSNKASLRHQKILNILIRKDRAQVADLIKELPTVTKRTIRRDLDELMKRGRVIRAGAWNQVSYQIANRAGKGG